MASRKIIAVVEDNKDGRLLIKTILQDHYQVAEYASSYEAIEGMKKNVPDLVILDISLPGMDGVELLRKLRTVRRLKNLPAIALTAHAMTGDREAFLSSGFNGYVAKPIDEEEGALLLTVKNLLSLS